MLVWTTARLALPVSIRTTNGTFTPSELVVRARSAGYDLVPAGHAAQSPAVVR